MDILLRISKNFRNVSVDFLCSYKKFLFSRHFIHKLENEEIYTEQIEANKVVEKTFKKCKSAGYNKIHHRTHDGYADLSKRQALKCGTSTERFRKFNLKFTNKTKPRQRKCQKNPRTTSNRFSGYEKYES